MWAKKRTDSFKRSSFCFTVNVAAKRSLSSHSRIIPNMAKPCELPVAKQRIQANKTMLPPLPLRLLCSIMLRHAVALGWLYIESEETVCLLSQMEGHRKETVFNAQVGEGGTARLEPIGMVLKATSALYAHPCDSAATKWILKMQHKATFEDFGYKWLSAVDTSGFKVANPWWTSHVSRV